MEDPMYVILNSHVEISILLTSRFVFTSVIAGILKLRMEGAFWKTEVYI
jgi:hypothetical protein